MVMCSRYLVAGLAALALSSASALAGPPIAGVTYDYNPPLLPNPDDGNGEWTWNFAAKDLTETKLTDGIFGTLALSGSNVFTNGTWVGYSNDTAFEGHPRVDLNLGGTYQVQSVEVQYLIEAPPFIFAPQQCNAATCPPNGIDALTVFGSTDGVNYAPLGATNDFEPIFGPNGSQALNTIDARTAVIDFGPGGTTASHLRVDVRSQFTWIFLGEITVRAVPEPATISLLGVAFLGVALVVRRGR
jgi:PEP-CTERM motif